MAQLAIAPSVAATLPPELRTLVAAADGDVQGLADLGAQHGAFLQRIELEGRARYGPLGLSQDEVLAAFARLGTAILAAELRRGGGPEKGQPLPSISAIVEALVPSEAYLAEALVRGRASAWHVFDTVLERSLRLVRGQYPGVGPQRALEEVAEGLQGAFWADGRIASFRATAPIGAWTRQVLLNMVRQRLASQRTRPAPLPLSTLQHDDEAGPPPIPDPGASPEERVTEDEWADVLRRAVPAAVARLDRDERRMLRALPTREITQVALAKELGVSPFKLNRWYKEVRERFLRELTHQLRLEIGLEAREAEGLVGYLARALEGKSV